jgi:dienelactone hydrolase
MQCCFFHVVTITSVFFAATSVIAEPDREPATTLDAGKLCVRTADDWAKQRRAIVASVEKVMGKLPDRSTFPPLAVKMEGRAEQDGFSRLSITYQTEEGERVPAYLLLPNNLPADRRAPAMIALHQTTKYGKKEVAGEAGNPNLAYAKELAQRGYVVLAPDYPSYGDYPYDFKKSKYASGCMKAIVNHMRGNDLLQARPEVDPKRIGVIGHSLGGHNAIFLGVFDERIKVVVSSCGWCPFRDSLASQRPDGWNQDVYMPRITAVYHGKFEELPFDLGDLPATLAPRAFFSNSPTGDEWFAAAGVQRIEPKTRDVFNLFGASDNFCARYPSCSHGFPPNIRREAYAFVDRVFHHIPRKRIP